MEREINIAPQTFDRLHPVQERSARLAANQRKIFQCSTCNRICSSKHCLNEHKYTHTNERVYPCPVCRRMFKYASQLSNHKKCHLKERQIRWLKLTDFIKPDEKKIYNISGEYSEIRLPSVLSGVQPFTIPTIDSLRILKS